MKHKFTNFFNYFFSLLVVLTLTIGQMWADDCTTLVSFATNQHQTSSPRKVYGYTSTEMTDASRIELTCDNSNTKGQNSGAEIRLDYGKYLEIPSQTSVTSVTVDYKFYNSGNTQRTCSLKVAVGSTEKQVLISGKNSDGYQPAEFTFSPAATGVIRITNMGSGSSNMNLYLDNISYCCSGGGGGGCTNVGIGTQPTSPIAATVGSACSISGLVASGTNPTYQWYTCNSDGSSASAISAAGAMSFTGYTTATLGLTPTAEGATYYKCVVSGNCGDPVTSNVVTVNASPAYSVTYNDNGKTGGGAAPSDATAYASGAEVTVLGNPNDMTKTNCVFIGWNTKADGTGTIYMEGEKFNMPSENTTLYAMWGVKLSWVVQVNVAETTVTTTSTASSYTTGVAAPSNLALNDLEVTSSSKSTATNKISTTKAKGGYISATFAVQSGYEFTPTHMVLKTTAISEAITVEVNVGSEAQTWAQPKSGSDPDLHVYKFADPEAITGSGTMKIYAYGGSDGTKGYRLGTPIEIYGFVTEAVAPSGYAITTSTTNGTIAVTDGSSAISSADEDDVVYIAATPDTGYGFTSWDIYKTSDATTKVSLLADDDADNKTRKFSMPAYAVTVGATFTAINYTVTLENGETDGAATVHYGDAALTITTAVSGEEGDVLSGFYTAASEGTKVAEADGTLVASVTGYTDENGKWIKEASATLYAIWIPYVPSSDATLSDLTVGGTTVTGFDAATTSYNVELPFGTTSAPTVDGTANDAKAKSVVVTQAASASGDATVVVTAEDNSTKTYTIHFSVVSSKDIRMVWKTTGNPCGESSAPSAVVLSTNDAIKDYLSISFVQTTDDNSKKATESSGSSLNTGKSVGNLVKITAKPGFAFKNMSFYGKIESSEVKCPVSIDGGETWTDVTGNLGSDAQHCNVFTNEEAHEITLKNNAGAGTWIRHMDLTMIQACTPKTIAWTTEPAAEYEVGATGLAIVASANNGTVSYAASNAAITVNASTGALTINSLTNDIDLSASVLAGDGTTYCATPASVVKEEIKTYYLVTFDAQNETAATPVKYYSGDAAIALPNPSYPGFVFKGWFDAATGGTKITEAITPTASGTVYAQWEAQCAGPTITVQPASASYFVGRTASALTCEATAGAAGALTYTWYSCDDAERTNPVALAGAPTPSTAAVGTFYYYCTVQEAGCDAVRTSDVAVITVTEKDMLRIIKIATTGGSNKTVTGYFAKAADCAVSLQSDSKFGTSSYMKMALDEEEFQAGDVLNVHITTVAGGGSIALYSTNNSDDALLYNSGVRGVVGDNKITLTDAIEGRSTLYLCRTSGNGWNPYVDYIEVYRPFPQPLLTGMTIDGAVAVVDELDATVYNVTIPAGSELASLDVEPTFLSNDPSLTNGAVSGSWTIGSNTYVVTDKDGDSKSYTINIARDAAVESVSVSGEATVAAKSQITLTATVLPAEVSNKAVTWSSSDETKATVDANGVVTGKAAGSVTITATSVADGTKKGTKEITVTKFVGTERVYWFAYAADAEANGVENNSEVFGSAPTGTTNGVQEITLEEGWVVNTTKKAGSSTLGSFTVPVDFTATLYVVVKGSGSSGRYIQLKQSDVVKYTSEEFGSADPTVLKIDGVAAGTYTIANVGGLSNFYLYAAELNSYPLTSVALEEGFNLRLEQSRTPIFTITPAKAAVASQVWSEVSRTGASDATLNTSTGEITAGAEEGTLTVKVTLTDAFGNEAESGNCVVKIVNIIDQKDVTGSMTWNWTGAATASVTIDNEEALVLANYIDGDEWAYLKGTNGDQAYHHESSYGSYQGKGTLSFKTTVPGLVTITARRISNNADLKIGEDAVLSLESSNKTSKAYFVPAGEVNIIADAIKGMRILKIEFDAEPTVDKIEGSHFGGYTREVNPQYYGTICLPKAGVMVGATVFEIAYMDYKDDGVTPYKVYYDQVENGIMEAGMPYIFWANQSTIGVYYTGTAEETAKHHNGLYGTLANITEGMNAEGIYMLYNNRVVHSTNSASSLSANRAYIQISEIPGYGNPGYMAPAPKYRRISTNFNGTNTATGLDEIGQNSKANSQKLLINGQLFILRGEKIYDATGRLVK